jgi:hypothetical protein
MECHEKRPAPALAAAYHIFPLDHSPKHYYGHHQILTAGMHIESANRSGHRRTKLEPYTMANAIEFYHSMSANWSDTSRSLSLPPRFLIDATLVSIRSIDPLPSEEYWS